jgi:hypothetical protein
MDSEFQELENTLKGLRPTAPDAACLNRLLAAVEGRLQAQELSTAGIESRLATMQPAAVSPLVFDKMLETVTRVPFPVNEKVVLFPGSAKPAAAKSASRRPWYAAAAAVAVAGAFTAMMVDSQPGAKPASAPLVKEFTSLPKVNGNGIVSASSGLQNATDQGVRWTKDRKPMRMVQVEYKDRMQVRNKEGKLIEVEVPRFEYILVPEKID